MTSPGPSNFQPDALSSTWLQRLLRSSGVVESSSSSEDEANVALAEAGHDAAQARVRLLEARAREPFESRVHTSIVSSASETYRPAIPHEPVFPVVVTPPCSPWRRSRPLQGMMPRLVRFQGSRLRQFSRSRSACSETKRAARCSDGDGGDAC